MRLLSAKVYEDLKRRDNHAMWNKLEEDAELDLKHRCGGTLRLRGGGRQRFAKKIGEGPPVIRTPAAPLPSTSAAATVLRPVTPAQEESDQEEDEEAVHVTTKRKATEGPEGLPVAKKRKPWLLARRIAPRDSDDSQSEDEALREAADRSAKKTGFFVSDEEDSDADQPEVSANSDKKHKAAEGTAAASTHKLKRLSVRLTLLDEATLADFNIFNSQSQAKANEGGQSEDKDREENPSEDENSESNEETVKKRSPAQSIPTQTAAREPVVAPSNSASLEIGGESGQNNTLLNNSTGKVAEQGNSLLPTGEADTDSGADMNMSTEDENVPSNQVEEIVIEDGQPGERLRVGVQDQQEAVGESAT